MYFLSDGPAAIREIQKFLHTVSDKTDNDIRRVAIDGIYGYETEMAVRDFQNAYGIPVNGVVDLLTFELLFEKYSEIMDDISIRDYVITNAGFPISVGMQGHDVITVHSIIKELTKTYTDIERIIEGAYYSERSARAVKDLQKIFMLEENGEVDEYLFRRFLTEIDAIRRLEEEYI